MTKKTALLAAAIALIVGGLATFVALAQPSQATAASGTPTARVVVPRVVGMRMDQATRTLRSRGLRVTRNATLCSVAL